VYLSDDMAEPTKWTFPSTASIPAHGYLLVWADDDESSTIGYHASFKLSAAGEQLTIGYASGPVLDSLSFGQQTADVSMSRCPNDATGSIVATANTTPGAANDCTATTDIAETAKNKRLLIYPNPAGNYVNIALPDPGTVQQVVVHTLAGEVVYRASASGSAIINTESWPAGTYFVSCGTLLEKLVKE